MSRPFALASLLVTAAVLAAPASSLAAVASFASTNAQPLFKIGGVARAAPPPQSRWVHREGKHWRYFVPDRRWRAVESEASIDVTSPTGELYAGYGFSGWPTPVTHQDVVDYLERTVGTGGGFDVHVLTNFERGELGPPRPNGPAQRRTLEYTARRPGLNQDVRGVMEVDVIRDDATGTYGFAVAPRVMPVTEFDDWNQTLAQLQSLFSYMPRSPR